MQTLLDRIEGRDIYLLERSGNKTYIRILGYYYNAGFSLENDGRDWRYNEYSGYEMPLSEFLASTEEDRAGWEEMYTRGIGDYTAEEVASYFSEDNAPVMRLIQDITEEDAYAFCEFIDAVYNH